MDKIEILTKIIKEVDSIVFFGGAGVSTESGIPDFRSPSGLYNTKMRVESLRGTSYTAEEILSHTFFMQHPNLFFDYYFDALINPNVVPNFAHIFLTKLEKKGKLKAIVTQNIDGLHQMAGSQNVIELHGSVKRNYCMKCNQFYNDVELLANHAKCPKCGGIIKPDVVLYEEPLNYDDINKAINAISNAECLIIGGTSLNVYPAASFIQFFRGKYLIIINRDNTNMDDNADLVIHEKIGEVFKKANEILNY